MQCLRKTGFIDKKYLQKYTGEWPKTMYAEIFYTLIKEYFCMVINVISVTSVEHSEIRCQMLR